MVYRFALGALFNLLLGSATIEEQASLSGHVIAVIDGNTIQVLTTEHTLFQIKLGFIDAPEPGQVFGNSAKRAIKALVFDREVGLRPYATDRCRCLVCTVFVGGMDVGLEMLKNGLAWVYEHYITEAPAGVQRSYQDAQRMAQEQRLGLWQEDNPEPPWEFRKKHGRGFPVPPV